MAGAGSVGSGGVVFGVAVGTSSMPWILGTSLDLESDPGSFGSSDPGSFGSSDPIESGFVLSVVGILRPCRMSVDGKSRNYTKSGTFSKGMGLLRKNRFCVVKRDHVSAKIVSILAE